MVIDAYYLIQMLQNVNVEFIFFYMQKYGHFQVSFFSYKILNFVYFQNILFQFLVLFNFFPQLTSTFTFQIYGNGQN